VKFDRPGVCFLFCNIHPEMSAVVMVLDTPYFAVSDKAGRYAIADVPGGRYMVNIWHERARPENPREFPHEVSISPVAPRLARIRLVDSGQLIPPHKNKYGKDYETPSGATYK
jgi:hypothetical protein